MEPPAEPATGRILEEAPDVTTPTRTPAAPPAAQRYALGRTETHGLFRGIGLRGQIWMGLWTVADFIYVALVRSPASVFVFVAVWLFAAVTTVAKPRRGKTLLHLTPLWAAFRRRDAAGLTTYRSGAGTAGYVIRGGGPDLAGAIPRPVDVAPPPEVGPAPRWLSTPSPLGDLAISVTPDLTCTFALRVEGPGLGLGDLAVREATAAMWSAGLVTLASRRGFISHVQLTSRTVAADPQAHSRYVDERGRRASTALNASYDELAATVPALTEDYAAFAVFRVGGAAFRRAVDRAGGGDRGIGAVVRAEMLAAQPLLESADMKVLAAVDVPATAALIRNQYDPQSPLSRRDLTIRDCWPNRPGRHEQVEYVEHDGWLSATVELKWPPVPVGVNFLMPLLVQTPGVIRTVTVVMRLLTSTEALTEARRALTTEQAEGWWQRKLGKTEDVTTERQRQGVEARLDDLGDGEAGVVSCGYATVTAPAGYDTAGSLTPQAVEGLEQAKSDVVSATAPRGMHAEWADYEQAAAFITALPLTRGIA